MNMLIPLSLSLLLGYYATAFILKKDGEGIHPGLQFVLSAGTGLGLSSCIVFLSFIVCRQYNPGVIWFAHCALWVMLFFSLSSKDNHLTFSFKIDRRKLWEIAALFTVGALLSYFVFVTALHTPYGQWDGWALWNMKAKFLMSNGQNWQGLFWETHNFTQPDYPVLLPCLLVWLASLTHEMPPYVPLFVGVFFTLGTSMLLFFGLCCFVKKYLAALGAGLFAFLPYSMYAGTSQYADILLAFYLLSVFVCLMTALQHHKERFFILNGLFLGFLAFSKNEGMLIAVIAFSVTAFFLFQNRPPHYRKNFRQLWQSTLLAMVPLLIFKLFLSLPNKDILIQNFSPSSRFFNLEGCYMVFSSFIKQFFSPAWGYAWLLAGFAAFICPKRYLHKETKIMALTILLFLLALILVYLATVNFSLMWRLSRTLPRILFYLYPSVLFLTFYAYGYKE